jgi:hypothetical protein
VSDDAWPATAHAPAIVVNTPVLVCGGCWYPKAFRTWRQETYGPSSSKMAPYRHPIGRARLRISKLGNAHVTR